MEHTCDACGRQFTFNDFRHDCCPKDEQDDIWGDDLTQESDESYRPEQPTR